jgi:hypothetical protein
MIVLPDVRKDLPASSDACLSPMQIACGNCSAREMLKVFGLRGIAPCSSGIIKPESKVHSGVHSGPH